MLIKLSRFTGSQHMNSVRPQSFALSREKPIPTFQSLGLVENSDLHDPLLVRGKIRRDQAPVLNVTRILLGPQ